MSLSFAHFQVDGKMGKGGLLLELRMLRLSDQQAVVRALIEKEQEDIQGMSERNYRKFARNCLRQRIEIIKQVCQAQSDEQPSAAFAVCKCLHI